jgi:hypothetical protein
MSEPMDSLTATLHALLNEAERSPALRAAARAVFRRVIEELDAMDELQQDEPELLPPDDDGDAQDFVRA